MHTLHTYPLTLRTQTGRVLQASTQAHVSHRYAQHRWITHFATHEEGAPLATLTLRPLDAICWADRWRATDSAPWTIVAHHVSLFDAQNRRRWHGDAVIRLGLDQDRSIMTIHPLGPKTSAAIMEFPVNADGRDTDFDPMAFALIRREWEQRSMGDLWQPVWISEAREGVQISLDGLVQTAQYGLRELQRVPLFDTSEHTAYVLTPSPRRSVSPVLMHTVFHQTVNGQWTVAQGAHWIPIET